MKPALVVVLTVIGGSANASPGPVPLATSSTIPAPKDAPYPGTLTLSVDTTDLAHRIYKVHEEIPVAAGDVVLFYPRWLPGTHSPEGPIDRFSGLTITARGARLEWTRDVLDAYAFHVAVPAGVTTISADYAYLSAVARSIGPQEVGREMLVVNWNTVVLYPAGYFTRQIQIAATIRVPDGWHVATALESASSAGASTTFKPVPVETLVDSPLHAGRFYKRYDLAPAGDKTHVVFDVMADRADLVELKPTLVELYRQLVQQAYRLFGAKHYDHYSFLLSLSDELAIDTTLEHHRSAEYGEQLEALSDWDKTSAGRDVVAHEYVHSWDGKFRRPADLWTPTFNTPMRDSLLWVYEGGTEYWGDILTARAGLWTKEQALDAIAANAAVMQAQAGRSWRPLQDTTNDEIINPRRPMSWPNLQRFEDYYLEGELIWLDADTLIREKTGGKKSLDDVAHTFFGIDDGSYVPVTYTFDDVVKALDTTVHADWATFLRTRLDGVGHLPFDGITRGGYKLVFTPDRGDFWKSLEEFRIKGVDHQYSLGVTVDKDAMVSYVAWDSPAAKAGVTAGMKLLAVDGLAYDGGRLGGAIERATKTKTPIELILVQGEVFKTVRVDYHGGLRYPHLVRDPSKPALLDDILAPRK